MAARPRGRRAVVVRLVRVPAAAPIAADAIPLHVTGLARRYGRLVGLAHFDLALERGECVALIGVNGSGKSTAVRTIAGLLEPSEGTVRICGHDPHSEPDAEAARAALALVPTRRCSTTISRSASTCRWSRSRTA
jgi:ABC-type cobalamin/Fe3+-siderophores transport system ATPase subunit